MHDTIPPAEAVKNALLEDYRQDHPMNSLPILGLQQNGQVRELIEKLRLLLFPSQLGDPAEHLEQTLQILAGQIEYCFRLCGREVSGEQIAMQFLSCVPQVRFLLRTDLEAALAGDPAAEGFTEIACCYPGFFAVMVHRLAHVLYTLNVPLLPRIMSEYAHSVTGIDIHPGAEIGSYFFIDHGTGVVIGQTARIGSHVKLYQGVTLGALSTRGGQGLHGVRRHPAIEDRVTIYVGATVLGGNTVIGADSVIGANAFITSSVAPGTTVKSSQ